jgi:hypothetical protein
LLLLREGKIENVDERQTVHSALDGVEERVGVHDNHVSQDGGPYAVGRGHVVPAQEVVIAFNASRHNNVPFCLVTRHNIQTEEGDAQHINIHRERSLEQRLHALLHQRPDDGKRWKPKFIRGKTKGKQS